MSTIKVANDLAPDQVRKIVEQFGGEVIKCDSGLFTLDLPSDLAKECQEALREQEDEVLGPISKRFQSKGVSMQ